MGETIRAFIAIELTPELQEELSRVQAELKKSSADVKWIESKQIHLTLKFLGNISNRQAEETKKAMTKIAHHISTFRMSLSEIGAFPKIEYPRIIWVGVEEGRKQLKELNSMIENELGSLDFPKETKEFHPHVTLGRVKSSKNKLALKQHIESIGFVSHNEIEIKQLTLFESILTPEGPLYTPLYKAALHPSS